MQVQATQFADHAVPLATEPAKAAAQTSAGGGSERTATAQPAGIDMSSRQVSVSVTDGQVFVYRILDEKTGDLIQQIPPDEILRLIRNIQEMLQETDRRAGVDIQL
jgi:FlaG protein